FNLPTYSRKSLKIRKTLETEQNTSISQYVKDTEYSFQLLLEDQFDNGTAGYNPTYSLYTGAAEIVAADNSRRSISIGEDGIFKLKPGETIEIKDLIDLKRYQLRELNVNSSLFSKVTLKDKDSPSSIQSKQVEGNANSILYTMNSDPIKLMDHYEIDAENFYYVTYYELPNSGGIGTYWFTMFGTALVTSVLLLYKKKRRRRVVADRRTG
ncbi:MAG: LPXTG cell wall anchor domain-containing protein, partial [Lachnospiraceae bacterium]|nr:LPXTG cell wall anchor domain-containing protein [Lachnospiraceae bacterium]